METLKFVLLWWVIYSSAFAPTFAFMQLLDSKKAHSFRTYFIHWVHWLFFPVIGFILFLVAGYAALIVKNKKAAFNIITTMFLRLCCIWE